MPLASNYDAKLYASKINQRWQEMGLGSPEIQAVEQNLSVNSPTHTILMPPPNLTGALHAGHSFQHFLMDTLSRIKRQMGHQNLWFPGVDHAGLQLEGVIDKLILKGEFDEVLLKAGSLAGLKLKSIPKEDWAQFLKKNYPEVWTDLAWSKVNMWRDNQKTQAEVLGDTPDYSRQLFTLDDRATDMVMTAFEKYWQDGLVYKGAYMVNWSVGLQTALADVPGETDYETRIDPLVNFEYEAKNWELNYDHKGFGGDVLTEHLIEGELQELLFVSQALKACVEWKRLLLSTVRIETLVGDVAVAMHPSKFEEYFNVGNLFEQNHINFNPKTALKFIELIKLGLVEVFYHIPALDINQPIKLVISPKVDPDFGTGVLKITPGHDIFDYELYKELVRNEVMPARPIQVCVGRNGKMLENAGKFSGLTVEQARVGVILKLLETGFIPNKLSETEIDINNHKQEPNSELKNELHIKSENLEQLLKLGYPQLIHNLSTTYPQADINWNYSHNVAICERSKTVVEPMISEEYFIDYYKEFSWKPKGNKIGTDNNVIIRPATEGDIDAILDIREQGRLEILNSIGDKNALGVIEILESPTSKHKDTEEWVQKWREFLKNKTYKINVAKHQSKVIGFVLAKIVLDNQEAVSELNNLFVVPSYQKQGVGKKLMNSVEDFLNTKPKRILSVLKGNQPAISFYQKLGYAITQKSDSIYKNDDQEVSIEAYKMEYLGPERVFDKRQSTEMELEWQPQRNRAVALIEVENTGKFVVFRKQRGSLEYYNNPKHRFLPGGGMEILGQVVENPIQTAVRETMEELGIKNLKHKQSLGVIRGLMRYQSSISNGLEHYELFGISMADFESRTDCEANKNHWQVELASLEELRQNGWEQLNYILDNYQYLGKKDLDNDLNTETTTLQKLGLRAIQETKFFPTQYQSRGQNFVENIKNWCISRNLIWGHKMPVWYRVDAGYNPEKKFYTGQEWQDNKVIRFLEDGTTISVRDCFAISTKKPQKNDQSGGIWVQEEKILDTWVSSCLWPLSTLNYFDYYQSKKISNFENDFAKYYPTQEMVTSKDIFYQWIIRMSMLCYYFTGQVPYQSLIITPTILDEQGRKMSKSLGNGLDPVLAIEKFSADSLRMTMLGIMIPDRNARMGGALADKLMEKYRNFGNKLWNVGRFLEFKQIDYTTTLPELATLKLTTDRLSLEALKTSDAELLFPLLTPNIRKYFYHFTKIEELQDWINYSIEKMQSKQKIELVIKNHQTGDVLGLISLRDLHTNLPAFGMWIREDYQRQKIGTEAVLAVIDWAKANLQYFALDYSVAKDNQPSFDFASSIVDHFGGSYLGQVEKEIENELPDKSSTEPELDNVQKLEQKLEQESNTELGQKDTNLVTAKKEKTGQKIHKFQFSEPTFHISPASQWLLVKFENLERVLAKGLETYELAHSVDVLYDFLWNDMADWLVEYLKTDISQQPVILEIYRQYLITIYPYMPTESTVLWQEMGFETLFGKLEFIIKDTKWLTKLKFERQNSVIGVTEFEQVIGLVASLRSLRGLFNIDPAKELVFYSTNQTAQKYQSFIKQIARAKLVIEEKVGLYQVVAGEIGYSVDIFSYIQDMDAEIKRSNKQLESLQKQAQAIENQLANPDFVARAESEVVEEKRLQLGQRKAEIEATTRKIEFLKTV